MSRRCTVCTHESRRDIDRSLALGDVSIRRIAAEYGLSESALRRHRNNHLSKAIVQAAEAEEVAAADDLLSTLRGLLDQAQRILTQAEKNGNHRVALRAIQESRQCVETLGRFLVTAQSLQPEPAPVTLEAIDAAIEQLEAELDSRLAEQARTMTDEELYAEYRRVSLEVAVGLRKALPDAAIESELVDLLSGQGYEVIAPAARQAVATDNDHLLSTRISRDGENRRPPHGAPEPEA